MALPLVIRARKTLANSGLAGAGETDPVLREQVLREEAGFEIRQQADGEIGFALRQLAPGRQIDPQRFDAQAGARLRTRRSSCGSSETWLSSVMQMRKLRRATLGSKACWRLVRRWTISIAARTGPISASALGVGSSPLPVRTNS